MSGWWPITDLGTQTLSRCSKPRPIGSTRCARSRAWTGLATADLAFAAPEAARRLKGAVVANQLSKLGGYHWCDEADAFAEPVGSGAPIGWRTRVRLDTSDDGRAGFHRYHSAELVTDLRCGSCRRGRSTA